MIYWYNENIDLGVDLYLGEEEKTREKETVRDFYRKNTRGYPNSSSVNKSRNKERFFSVSIKVSVSAFPHRPPFELESPNLEAVRPFSHRQLEWLFAASYRFFWTSMWIFFGVTPRNTVVC